MIVTVAEIKDRLGIDPTDTDDDARIESLIKAATAWVQNSTRRYFDEPVSRTEYHEGCSHRKLYLQEHLEEEAEDSASDGLRTLRVFTRPLYVARGTAWAELEEGVDYEQRTEEGQTYLLPIGMWGFWTRGDEYRLIYPAGYRIPPDDIKQLIVELVIGGYNAEVAQAAGVAGITSETIGDYSYTLDPAAAVAAAAAGGMTDVGKSTLKNWKRQLV